MIAAGMRLDTVRCPDCGDPVAVECGPVGQLLQGPHGAGAVVALALDRARKSCPGSEPAAHAAVHVEDGSITEDIGALCLEFAGMLAVPPLLKLDATETGWTPEQARAFQAEWDRLQDSGDFRHREVRLLPPGITLAPVIHIAGDQVQVGSRLRQRCAWCGVILGDYDLNRIAVPEGQDPRPGMWATGQLVRVDGIASFVVEHEDGAELPEDCCAVAEIDGT